VTGRERVADRVQHHHLGRDAGDDQILPASCGNRGVRRFVQQRAERYARMVRHALRLPRQFRDQLWRLPAYRHDAAGELARRLAEDG
jgi:hypothetical protein